VPVGHVQTPRAWVVVACLGYSRPGAGALVFSAQIPDLLFAIRRCRCGALQVAKAVERRQMVPEHDPPPLRAGGAEPALVSGTVRRLAPSALVVAASRRITEREVLAVALEQARTLKAQRAERRGELVVEVRAPEPVQPSTTGDKRPRPAARARARRRRGPLRVGAVAAVVRRRRRPIELTDS
jgi:hypothetical protein